jgi:uncharacterized protein
MNPAKLRVVLDTNVVLSALIFQKGRTAILREAWQAEQFCPLISHATATELIRTLKYPKFKLTKPEQDGFLADYLPYCAVVNISNPPPKTPICRDPADIAFMQLALAGTADYLVSGDKDLLMLAGELTCPIVTADNFISNVLKD